jgi:hypothetical protein
MVAWIQPPLSVLTSHLPGRLWPRGFSLPSAFQLPTSPDAYGRVDSLGVFN